MKTDICYAVKSKGGYYWCGSNVSISDQLKDAKLYHSNACATGVVELIKGMKTDFAKEIGEWRVIQVRIEETEVTK